MNAGPDIVVDPDVEAALREGRPVVALESAVITHGLPRRPAPHVPADLAGWDPQQPVNLQAALKMQKAVRDAGAVPATMAVLAGKLHVGLSEAQLHELATNPAAEKASTATIAGIMSRRASAGTTVSATLIACRRAPRPIRTFATGGIGGVHAGWSKRPDVSADLLELARTQTCVVSSGGKSILDLPATVEALETLGVPVIGVRTSCFAGFYLRQVPGLTLADCADTAQSVADLCRAHWRGLKQRSGVLAINPVPERYALAEAELQEAMEAAEGDARERGVTGAARTPFLLDAIAQRTGGRSLVANLALLLDNAGVAAEIAGALPRELVDGAQVESPADGNRN